MVERKSGDDTQPVIHRPDYVHGCAECDFHRRAVSRGEPPVATIRFPAEDRQAYHTHSGDPEPGRPGRLGWL